GRRARAVYGLVFGAGPPSEMAAAAASGPAVAEARLRGDARDSEGRELLEHVGRATVGADDRLLLAADELLEVRLALHARVLVDRHRPYATSPYQPRPLDFSGPRIACATLMPSFTPVPSGTKSSATQNAASAASRGPAPPE